MSAQIDVRPARGEDKDAVLAFCRDTFSWGDYVPDVWDDWLSDSAGQMFVGTFDQKPVGLLHVAFLDHDVAWLEGMRVHPDWRRKGVGTAMDASAKTLARERGCRVARLATSITNIPAQRTLASQGYAYVARFNEWKAQPASSKFNSARVATREDSMRVLETWRGWVTDAPARTLLPDRHWHWWELTPVRLIDQIDAGEVRLAGDGFAILFSFNEKDWSGLSLHALVGDEETAFTLARAARGEARYRGFPRLEAMVVDHAPLNAALERAGYHRQGGMFICEQALE